MIVGDTVILKNKLTKHKITKIEGKWFQVDNKARWYNMETSTVVTKYRMGELIRFDFQGEKLIGKVISYTEMFELYQVETEDEVYSVPPDYIEDVHEEMANKFKSLLKEMVE